ncbi:MAG: Fe-S cluster assembly protein SufD [Bacteroidota bacterium]
MSTIVQNKTTSKDWFSTLFKMYEQGLNGHSNHPIAAFRRQAFTKFERLEFPTTRDEDWKYTSVKRIFQRSFKEGKAVELSAEQIQNFEFDGLETVRLVFVNGVWNEQLSDLSKLPKEVQLQTLEKAIEDKENKGWIETQVEQKGGTGKNTFLPLNRAFADNGIFVRVAKNYQFRTPIHLLNISVPSEEAHLTHPQLFVWAGVSSEVSIIESYHSLNKEGAYFNNTASYFDVEANANVHHYRLQYENQDAFQINNTIVRQHRDSTYSSYAVDLGGRMVRNNLSTELLDSGTMTNYYGVYLGTGTQHIDNQTFIDHAMPHCNSNELYKGILTDRSRGVFNGKVMVRQDAQKTNAFQQNSSLVLSPRATMDAKPQLEIYADDVRCSHGATIGQLDEGSIFYLRSRGIPEGQAKGLLQKAFVAEAIEAMKIDAILENVVARIEEKLS